MGILAKDWFGEHHLTPDELYDSDDFMTGDWIRQMDLYEQAQENMRQHEIDTPEKAYKRAMDIVK